MHQLHRILFLAMAGWALWPLHLYNYLGFLLLVVGVLRGFSQLKPKLSVHWITALPAFLALLWYYMTPEMPVRASVTLTHAVHLAVMPLGLILYRPQAKNWTRDKMHFLRVYVAAVGVAFLYFNLRIALGWEWDNPNFGTLQTHDLQTIYRNHFISFTGHHPTYFSYLGWFATAVLAFVPEALPRRGLRWAAILLVFSGTLALGSRMPLMAAGVAFFVVRGKSLWSLPQFRYIFVAFGVLGFGLMYPRWEELKALIQGDVLNSASIRLQLWICWWQEWIQRPWWGWGTGASLDQLQVCFEEREFYTAYDQHLNPHNQYAQWLMDWGIAGLGTLFAGAAYLWNRHRPTMFPLFRFFLVFIALSALTESLLNRQLGIVFVGLWFSFLVLYNTPDNEESP